MSSQNSRVVVAVGVDRADEYGGWLEGYEIEQVADESELLAAVDVSTAAIVLDRTFAAASAERLLDRIREHGVDRPVVLVADAAPDADGIAVRFTETLVRPVEETALVDAVAAAVDLTDEEVQKQEYVSLAATQAAMELDLSPAERESNDQYDRLTDRISALRDRAEGSLDDVGDQLA
jgi:FixJ family two-component response regulator